jgi:hypothetical protein
MSPRVALRVPADRIANPERLRELEPVILV